MTVLSHPSTQIHLPVLPLRTPVLRTLNKSSFQSAHLPLPLQDPIHSFRVSSPLTDLISTHGPFLPKSTILGVCEDGSPLLADFANVDTGSILVTGPLDSVIAQFLRFFLDSIPQINSPSDLCYQVISPNPYKFYPDLRSPNCSGLHHNRSPQVASLLESYLAVSRQEAIQTHSSATLLVIDDLADFIHGLDEETFWGFAWLVHAGRLDQLRIIATQPASTLAWVDRELLSVFDTRIQALSRISNPIGWAGSRKQVFHVPYQDAWFSVSHKTREAF